MVRCGGHFVQCELALLFTHAEMHYGSKIVRQLLLLGCHYMQRTEESLPVYTADICPPWLLRYAKSFPNVAHVGIAALWCTANKGFSRCWWWWRRRWRRVTAYSGVGFCRMWPCNPGLSDLLPCGQSLLVFKKEPRMDSGANGCTFRAGHAQQV